jgi:tetratricopeptide (TPR) repeat protein
MLAGYALSLRSIPSMGGNMLPDCLHLRFRLPTATILAVLFAGLLAAHAQPIDQPTISAASPSATSITKLDAPPSPEELGDALMLHKRYQAAIDAFRQAPQNSARIWNKMGIANQMMFNMQEATRCYRASLKIDPKDYHVYNNLGTIYDSLRRYKEAEKMYRKALKMEPHSALINKNLGTNLISQHKYPKGWEYYQAAVAIDPLIFERDSKIRIDNPGSVQERGAMNYYMAKGCVRAGMNDRAIEHLRYALNQGFTSAKKIAADNEFAKLRGVPAFDQLLAERNTP